MAENFDVNMNNESDNFDINLNDEVENFAIEFGETTYITENDFDKLENRPSYNSQVMTHETNIPKVPVNVSELNNDTGYQTEAEVKDLVDTKQNKLTAGNNIQISEQNVISATNTTYSAGNGINISGQNAISVDTTIVATQDNLSDEVTNRENADNALQEQIDGISASSDVVDIVGTYAELQAYDTQHLKDNDIVKVLQDDTQNNATTYYRWNIHTQEFTLIGQEGPYYTKAAADSQFVPQTRTVNSKALSSNIVLTASDVSALGTSDVVQTTGTSTSQVMSQNAVSQELATKLDASDYVVDDHLDNTTNPVQNQVLNGLLGDMPADFFSGEANSNPTPGTSVELTNAIKLKDIGPQGDNTQIAYSGKNLLPYPYYESSNTSHGIKYTARSDGTIILDGTWADDGGASAFVLSSNSGFTLPAGTYYLPDQPTKVGMVLYDGTTYHSLSVGNNYKLTLSSTTTFRRVYLQVGTINLIKSFNNDTFYPMITTMVNPSISDYEPYVGGTSSPNPDYPQNVNIVTGEQNITVYPKQKNIADPQTFIDWVYRTYALCLKYNYSSDAYRPKYGELQGREHVVRFSGSTLYSIRNEMVNPTYSEMTIVYDNFKPNTVYTVSMDMYSTGSSGANNLKFVYTDGTTKNLVNTGSANTWVSISSTSESGKTLESIRIAYNDGSSYIDLDTFQIEEGATKTSYEEFQKNVYLVNLGKNLWDPSNILVNTEIQASGETASNNSRNTLNYTKIMSEKTYSLSGASFKRVCIYDSSKTLLSTFTLSGTSSIFVTPTNSAYIRVSIDNTATYNEVQLELNDHITSYAPYFTPIKLGKLGANEDAIFNNNPSSDYYDSNLEEGAWFVHKEVGEIILNGTEADFYYLNGVYYTNGVYGNFADATILSNYYLAGGSATATSTAYANGNNKISLNMNDKRSFYLRNDNLTSVSDWQTWLSNHNTTIYYASSTHNNTKITNQALIDQLEAFKNTLCYDNTTYIDITATNLPALLNLTAYNKNLNGIVDILRGDE